MVVVASVTAFSVMWWPAKNQVHPMSTMKFSTCILENAPLLLHLSMHVC